MPTTFHKAACIIATASNSGAFVLQTGTLVPKSGKFDHHQPPRKSRVSLDQKQVQHIALLARLKLDDSEYLESVEKLSRIVAFVDQLSQADTQGVVPMAHPLDMAIRLRPDVVSESNERDRYQQNAADVSNGYYLVPKVIE